MADALEAAGATAILTRDRDVIANANGLVVVGEGAFSDVMAELRETRGDELIERRLAGGRPVLAPTLPHSGWNTVDSASGSALFVGIETEKFYFEHSAAATAWSLEVYGAFAAPRVTYATHGERFLAAVENGPLTATQFHPETSGDAGMHLMRNWVQSL